MKFGKKDGKVFLWENSINVPSISNFPLLNKFFKNRQRLKEKLNLKINDELKFIPSKYTIKLEIVPGYINFIPVKGSELNLLKLKAAIYNDFEYISHFNMSHFNRMGNYKIAFLEYFNFITTLDHEGKQHIVSTLTVISNTTLSIAAKVKPFVLDQFQLKAAGYWFAKQFNIKQPLIRISDSVKFPPIIEFQFYYVCLGSKKVSGPFSLVEEANIELKRVQDQDSINTNISPDLFDILKYVKVENNYSVNSEQFQYTNRDFTKLLEKHFDLPALLDDLKSDIAALNFSI